MKNFSKHAGEPVTIEQRRPPSHVISFWCGCVRVNIGLERLHEVDSETTREVPSDTEHRAPHGGDRSWLADIFVFTGYEHLTPTSEQMPRNEREKGRVLTHVSRCSMNLKLNPQMYLTWHR